MSNEPTTGVASEIVDEDQRAASVAQDVAAAEPCSAKCPTCQQNCAYSAGHAGLHHCENGHEWI